MTIKIKANKVINILTACGLRILLYLIICDTRKFLACTQTVQRRSQNILKLKNLDSMGLLVRDTVSKIQKK